MGYVPPTWEEWNDMDKLRAWSRRGSFAHAMTAAAVLAFSAFVFLILIGQIP